MATTNNYLGLDIGAKRIGVAVASAVTRLPRPLVTLEHTDSILQDIKDLVIQESVGSIVVGLPRNLSGDDTAQTKSVREFAKELEGFLEQPVHLQDEALSSHAAETELQRQGKPYKKSDIDALAATVILGDYIDEHTEGSNL